MDACSVTKCAARRVRPRVLAGCGVVAVAATALARQAEQPTFRTGVELVQVAVVVTDPSGNPVTGLGAGDFQLLENATAQPIAAFEAVNAESARDTGPGAPPFDSASDVATNAGAADARLFVLLLDDLHIGPERTPHVRRLARQFVEQFTSASDLVMVIPTGGDTELVREFTTDRARVLQTIERFTGKLGPRSQLEAVYAARNALDVLQRLGEHLAPTDRRVAIALVSEGFSLNAISRGMRTAGSEDLAPPGLSHLAMGTSTGTNAFTRAIEALQNSNCAVYLVDPRGLSEGWATLAELQALALDTGGFFEIPSNSYDHTFDRIARENSSYYVLGFYPAPGGRPGQVREIDVKVPGRDVRVRSRRAFVIPEPSSESHAIEGLTPDLARVLRSPLPVAALPMRIQAIPFREAGQPRVLVVLEIEGDDVDLTSGQRLDIATTTIDSRGRASNGTMTPIALKLSDDEQKRSRLTGFRWMTTLSLRPGTHQLRVAAQLVGTTTRRAGLVHMDVEVPQIRRERLELTGMRVSSMVAPLYVTWRTRSSGVLPGPPPTAMRQFVAGDTLLINVDAYPPQRLKANIEFTATLEDSSRTVAWTNSKSIEPGPSAAVAEFQVPTRDLAAGWYVLRVTGSIAGRGPVERTARIEIVRARAEPGAR